MNNASNICLLLSCVQIYGNVVYTVCKDNSWDDFFVYKKMRLGQLHALQVAEVRITFVPMMAYFNRSFDGIGCYTLCPGQRNIGCVAKLALSGVTRNVQE